MENKKTVIFIFRGLDNLSYNKDQSIGILF